VGSGAKNCNARVTISEGGMAGKMKQRENRLKEKGGGGELFLRKAVLHQVAEKCSIANSGSGLDQRKSFQK